MLQRLAVLNAFATPLLAKGAPDAQPGTLMAKAGTGVVLEGINQRYDLLDAALQIADSPCAHHAHRADRDQRGPGGREGEDVLRTRARSGRSRVTSPSRPPRSSAGSSPSSAGPRWAST